MRIIAVVGCVLSLSATGGYSVAAESSSLVLVKDGKAACVIALPDKPTDVAEDAARELQDGLRRISDATVEIKKESALSPGERAGTLILVGEGELARQSGVSPQDLKPEGFHIRSAGNRLVLVGREDAYEGKERQKGTLWAVVSLLEDDLGMRWLWPGPLGEVVPKNSTIAVPPLDRTDAPFLSVRTIRESLTNPNPSKFGFARQALKMEDEPLAQMVEQSKAWQTHQRLGRSIAMKYQHGFTQWWEQYGEQHLDYFAMQVNGRRGFFSVLGGSERIKICVSNPAVLDQWTLNAEAFFKANPEVASFSASPNDNAYNGHCMCEACKAWDAPDAPKVTLNSVGPDGKKTAFEYPALTDRYVHFYNLAAERLRQVAPGKMVGGYAYGAWRTPPMREKAGENVVIGYVGFNRLANAELWKRDSEEWDAWAKAAQHIFLRPNLLHWGHGYPLSFTERLGATLSHCADTGMIGVDFDSLMHHWGNQGLNYYVLVKLLWNPKADVAKIVDDYCRCGFGKAAPAMKEYYQAVAEYTDRIGDLSQGGKEQLAPLVLPAHTPEQYAALEKPLARAKEMAAGDATVLERIAFIEKGLEYLKLHIEAVRVILATKKGGDETAMNQAIAARQKFYMDNKYSFAVGVPDIVDFDAREHDLYRGFSKKQVKGAADAASEADDGGA
ncbi:MAG: DUF4838 domain-containing protein [Candidatus Sumerlaeota bacterium]|nr:DUF4838 domain-containing protein [Candidatus Sumerlaeota bacterium]